MPSSVKASGLEDNSRAAYNFVFPELSLICEPEGANNGTDGNAVFDWNENDSSSKCYSFLYRSTETEFHAVEQTVGRCDPEHNASSVIPEYLVEERHMLTKMTKIDFYKCVLLNVVNYVGLLFLWASIQKGGVLEIQDHNSYVYKIIRSTLLLLSFYAKLFFIIPLCRMMLLLVLNHFINIRNERRKGFAHVLQQSIK